MRAIFFSILAFNVVLFAWGVFFSEGPSEAVVAGSSPQIRGVDTIQLLSEVEDLQALAEPLEAAEEGRVSRSVAGAVDKSAADKSLCEMVGAFRNRDGAKNFIERLKAIDVSGELKEMELPAGPGYWVYLAPEQSRRAALRKLGEIQAKGVDSYVIPKGEIANGISLGMFSQKNLSDLRLKEMKSIGLDPQLKVVERTYRELWVMLAQGEHKKMSKLTWERVLEGFDSVERRQNFCLDVASQDNFL